MRIPKSSDSDTVVSHKSANEKETYYYIYQDKSIWTLKIKENVKEVLKDTHYPYYTDGVEKLTVFLSKQRQKLEDNGID